MTEFVVSQLRTVLTHITDLSAKYSTAVRLVAVSKTFPTDYVLACYEQGGQRHFGENYVDELEEKATELRTKGAAEIRWHYIGRLQSNKIKKIASIPGLWCVETLTSRKHADLLQSAVATLERRLNVFIQVNTSRETNKGGVEPPQLPALAEHIEQSCPNLELLGLMTIGSLVESRNPEENADFARLRQLRDELALLLGRPLELSMGMSSDYAHAIQYGSTNVRVGSTIFGQRSYPNAE